MSYLRLLHLATSAGLCGFFYISHLNKLNRVNAQPEPAHNHDCTFQVANEPATVSFTSCYCDTSINETPKDSLLFTSCYPSLDETVLGDKTPTTSMLLRHSDLSVDESCIHAPDTTFQPSFAAEDSISFVRPCPICDPTFQSLTSTPVGVHSHKPFEPTLDLSPFGNENDYCTPAWSDDFPPSSPCGAVNLSPTCSSGDDSSDLNLKLSPLDASDDLSATFGQVVVDSCSESPCARSVRGPIVSPFIINVCDSSDSSYETPPPANEMVCGEPCVVDTPCRIVQMSPLSPKYESDEYYLPPVQPIHKDTPFRNYVSKGQRIRLPRDAPDILAQRAIKGSSYTSTLPDYEEPTRSPPKKHDVSDRSGQAGVSPPMKRDLSGGSGYSPLSPSKKRDVFDRTLDVSGGSGQDMFSSPRERDSIGSSPPSPLSSPQIRELLGSGHSTGSPAKKRDVIDRRLDFSGFGGQAISPIRERDSSSSPLSSPPSPGLQYPEVCVSGQRRSSPVVQDPEVCAGGQRKAPPSPEKVEIRWAPQCECKSDNKHFPNIIDVQGFDFTVCRNYDTGVPNWTLQHVTCRVSDHCSCRYCRSIRFPCERRCEEENPIDIKEFCDLDVDPCVFQFLPPQPSRCQFQNNSLWDDFYHYTMYLAEKYERIYVCSIPGYLSHEADPTHFYKVIVTKEKTGCYQFECYKFENKQIPVKNPELVDYRVLRGRVELETGVKLFPLITRIMIGSKKPHFSEFTPHRDCPICFPNPCRGEWRALQ